MTVWDLRTRQPIRTLQKGGKGPVTGLLVMDRPAYLAAGQGGRGARRDESVQNSASRKGPQRPQPLAPFSKYYGVAGGLKPWQGVPVLIDGSTPYRYNTSSFSSQTSNQTACHTRQPPGPVKYTTFVTKAHITKLCMLAELAVLSVALLLANCYCALQKSSVQWLQLCCKRLWV